MKLATFNARAESVDNRRRLQAQAVSHSSLGLPHRDRLSIAVRRLCRTKNRRRRVGWSEGAARWWNFSPQV